MLRQYNIRELKKVCDNEEEVNRHLADSWLLLDVLCSNGHAYYIIAQFEKMARA